MTGKHDHDARGIETAEYLERLADTMCAASGGELPRAYFLEQLRRNLAIAAETAEKEETLQSSACFDAWARAS